MLGSSRRKESMGERIDLLGIRIDNLTMPEVLNAIDSFIQREKPSLVCTANANHIRLVRTDDGFANIYKEADLVTADGMSIIWASRILGRPLREKVSGIDLTVEICKRSSARGYRIYFLGAADGIAEKAKKRCEKMFPGIAITGYFSPCRGELLDDGKSKRIVAMINDTKPNILLAAFGPPIQEKWIKRNMPLLKVPVSIGVGGAIDYLAEDIKRPPVFVRKAGLEWLARLVQKPGWYWKRYARDSLIFYYIIEELIRILLFRRKQE
jgi:N-acetylglucosaminyldiphosphoundecaprenol N-acetyl-beta-D-mannosaminyltransferase